MRFLTSTVVSLGALTMLLSSAPSARADSKSRCGYTPPCCYTPPCYTPPCYTHYYTPPCYYTPCYYTPCYSSDCYYYYYDCCDCDCCDCDCYCDRGAHNHKKVAAPKKR